MGGRSVLRCPTPGALRPANVQPEVFGGWSSGATNRPSIDGIKGHTEESTPRTASVTDCPALSVNGMVVLMLYRYRPGDGGMRAVLLCSRNDTIGDVAAVLPAGEFGTGSAWPALIVASKMVAHGISSRPELFGKHNVSLVSSGQSIGGQQQMNVWC